MTKLTKDTNLVKCLTADKFNCTLLVGINAKSSGGELVTPGYYSATSVTVKRGKERYNLGKWYWLNVKVANVRPTITNTDALAECALYMVNATCEGIIMPSKNGCTAKMYIRPIGLTADGKAHDLFALDDTHLRDIEELGRLLSTSTREWANETVAETAAETTTSIDHKLDEVIEKPKKRGVANMIPQPKLPPEEGYIPVDDIERDERMGDIFYRELARDPIYFSSTDSIVEDHFKQRMYSELSPDSVLFKRIADMIEDTSLTPQSEHLFIQSPSTWGVYVSFGAFGTIKCIRITRVSLRMFSDTWKQGVGYKHANVTPHKVNVTAVELLQLDGSILQYDLVNSFDYASGIIYYPELIKIIKHVTAKHGDVSIGTPDGEKVMRVVDKRLYIYQKPTMSNRTTAHPCQPMPQLPLSWQSASLEKDMTYTSNSKTWSEFSRKVIDSPTAADRHIASREASKSPSFQSQSMPCREYLNRTLPFTEAELRSIQNGWDAHEQTKQYRSELSSLTQFTAIRTLLEGIVENSGSTPYSDTAEAMLSVLKLSPISRGTDE